MRDVHVWARDRVRCLHTTQIESTSDGNLVTAELGFTQDMCEDCLADPKSMTVVSSHDSVVEKVSVTSVGGGHLTSGRHV